MLAAGKCEYAIDVYTILTYMRKRHGPSATQQDARTLVERVRVQFATRDFASASESCQDAAKILEELVSDVMLLRETAEQFKQWTQSCDKGEETEQTHIAVVVREYECERLKRNKACIIWVGNLES